MPLYGYFCPHCHEHVEARASVEERDEVDCPHCEAKLKRLLAIPHAAPIPGIPNVVNRHWNEAGTPIDRGRVDEFVDRAERP